MIQLTSDVGKRFSSECDGVLREVNTIYTSSFKRRKHQEFDTESSFPMVHENAIQEICSPVLYPSSRAQADSFYTTTNLGSEMTLTGRGFMMGYVTGMAVETTFFPA